MTDTTTGKGLGVRLACSNSFKPISAGVIIRVGTSIVLSRDCPGAAYYPEPHNEEEPKMTTSCLVYASGAETEEEGVTESVRRLRGIL